LAARHSQKKWEGRPKEAYKEFRKRKITPGGLAKKRRLKSEGGTDGPSG